MHLQIQGHSLGDPRCCGDFAEHIYLDPYSSAIVIGDVAGKGPEVCRAADALRAYCRFALFRCSSLPNAFLAIDDYFTRTLLCEGVPFVSLFVAVTDVRRPSVRYASAGHEPAFVFHGRALREHTHLDPTGPLIGLRSAGLAPAFGERDVRAPDVSLLVAVTDGITESRRPEGGKLRFFGNTGVARAVHAANDCRWDIAGAIYRAALDHARGIIYDDATVLVSMLRPANRITDAKRRQGNRAIVHRPTIAPVCRLQAAPIH